MIVYLLTVLLSIFLVKIHKRRISLEVFGVKKRIEWEYMLIALPFVLTSCLRYNVGTDYSGYIERTFDAVDNSEIIFKGILYINNRILNVNHLTIVFFGLFFNILMFKFIYEYTLDLQLSVLLFFLSGMFNFSLNIMRQMLAVSVFFACMKYIESKDIKKYYINILFAILVHKTAIIYIPLYFLKKIKLKKSVSVILPIVLLLIQDSIRVILMRLSVRYSFYNGYFDNRYDFKKTSYSLLIINIVAYAFSYYLRYLDENNERNNLLFNLQFIALIFSEWVRIIPNDARIIYMFMPVQCIVIPNAVKCIRKRYRRIIIIGVLTIYSIFFIHYFYIRSYGNTFPYHSILLK